MGRNARARKRRKESAPKIITARAKYVRTSPRKTRLVADMIRGRKVEPALGILKATPRKAARLLAKVLNTAIANAENVYEVKDLDELFIEKVFVDEAPPLKRFRPRARGMASRIRHRFSHITMTLGGAIIEKNEEAGEPSE